MITASVTYEMRVLRIEPVGGFTATEEAKPESRLVVEHVPIYQITDIPQRPVRTTTGATT